MHLSNVGLLAISILDFALGLLVWKINKKNKINIFFALQMFGLSIWALGAGMFREQNSESLAWAWAAVQDFGGPIAILFFYIFTLYFPFQQFRISPVHKTMIILAAVFVLFMAFTPGFWIVDINIQPPQNTWVISPFAQVLFVGYFSILITLSFVNLLRKYLVFHGFSRRQIGLMLIGCGTLAFFSALLGALPPLITDEVKTLWIVPYFVLPLIIASIYLIFFSGRSPTRAR